MARSHRRTGLLLTLMALGVGGFAALTALAAHKPDQASLLHSLALGWLLVCGLARLGVVLFDQNGETRPPVRKRSWTEGPWG